MVIHRDIINYRTHEIKNLYVVDISFFTSNIGLNADLNDCYERIVGW